VSSLPEVSKVHGVLGAEGPCGPEVPRLSGVEVSKALRSPRCQGFGANVSSDLRICRRGGSRSRGMEGSRGLEVLRAL
jgi:hypothetical protein